MLHLFFEICFFSYYFYIRNLNKLFLDSLKKGKILAVSFNLELSSKPNRQGHWPNRIRITQDRKHTRLSTSVELKKKSDWNSTKQRVNASEPNCVVLNDVLDRE